MILMRLMTAAVELAGGDSTFDGVIRNNSSGTVPASAGAGGGSRNSRKTTSTP